MGVNELREPATLADVLRNLCATSPSAEAISDGTRRMTWAELQRAAYGAWASFNEAGLRKGDRIAVVLPNQIEAIVLYWACALSGVVFVAVNPSLGHDDMRAVLEHAAARYAFVSESMRPEIRAALPHDLILVNADEVANFFPKARAIDAQNAAPIAPDDLFAIVYTSGTTGAPKGVMLTHRGLLWNAQVTRDALRMTADDALLLAVQITHIFGLSAGILVAACAGARCVLMREHTAGGALDLCEWERITIHHGTPTMLTLELAAQRRAPRDLSSLRTGIIGGSPVAEGLLRAIRSDLHCDIQIAWGMTEASPCITITDFDDPIDLRTLTVGRPLPGVELTFRDDGGEFGEILVRSPGVFPGYFRDEAQTRAVLLPGGWLCTGDLGYLDDDGCLRLAGRQKEIIIRGGMHIYPNEVEEHVRELPWVDAVAIVGVPDAVLGERTCACVTIAEGHEFPADPIEAVRTAIAGKLADYKVPDLVLRVSDLPRTAGGKVLKRVLRERAMAGIAAG